MHYYAFLIAALSFQSIVSAHMLLSYPPAFRYQNNPNVPSGSIDYSLTSPLKADGSDFPCKGYQSDLGSPAGASVATWSAGGTYNFTIGGSAAHDGGSCQAALSYDKGKTFTVIHSYIGGCPTVNPAGGSFNFQVPSDAPQGAAMFAWTWFNEVGNREMYMDCASVTIAGSSSKRAGRAGKRAGTSFSSRPSLFVANLGNGCTTVESTDLAFPDPGPDVTNVSKAPGGVTGTCKQVAGIGDFASGSGNAASSPAGSSVAASSAATAGTSAVASSAAPVASASSINAGAGTVVTAASSHAASSYAAQTSSGSQAVTMSSAASTASSTGTSTSGLSLSSDGSCGGTFGCQGSIHGNCCSEWGWCGSTSAYCGTGCQSAFGSCGTSNSSSSGTSALQVSIDKTCGPTTSNTCQGSIYGNCCSQYGYCGNTSDYCGTGCQGGFGTCGLASAESSPSSASSMAVSSPSAMQSSSPASQATGGASAAGSGSSATSLSSTGVTQPTSQGSSGFITMAKPTTTTSISSTFTPDLVTIIPTHLRRRQSGKTISPNGLCGSSTGYTCMGSNFGECCSQYGYCGSSDAYCGTGCQNPFGSCKIEIIPTTL